MLKSLAEFFSSPSWPEPSWPEQIDKIVPAFAITSTIVPEPLPEFQRIYSARIMRGIEIKLTIKQFCGGMLRHGELTQPDGKWLLFEPERIADKIIDPILLPEVTRVVEEMMNADKKWRGSSISEFKNKNGETWKLVA